MVIDNELFKKTIWVPTKDQLPCIQTSIYIYIHIYIYIYIHVYIYIYIYAIYM